MDNHIKRPLFWAACAFLLGEAEAIVGGSWFLFAALFGAACLIQIARSWKTAVLFLTIGGIGCANGFVLRQQERYAETVSGSSGVITGRIYDIRETSSGKRVYLTVTEITGTDADGQQAEYRGRTKMVAYIEAGDVQFGQSVKISGSLKRLEASDNPGGFSSERYYAGRGIFLMLLSGEIVEQDTDRSLTLVCLNRIKSKASEVFEQVFSSEHASVMEAMLLGEKSALDSDIKKLYQINGIAHILAISGLHIAILGMTLFEFLRRRFGSCAISGGAALFAVLCYGVMTGLAGSTCRAVIMMALLIGGRIIGRTTDLLTSAGIACVAMTVANPYIIEDAGFQLSFGAVAGIAVIKPALDRIFGAGGRFRQSFFISLSSSAATLPVVIYYYYQFPLYGVWLNLVVVPLVSAVLMCGIAAAVCGLASLKLAAVPAAPAACILKLYRLLCSLMEHVPGYTVNVGHITVDMIVLYYAALLLLLLYILLRKKSRTDAGRMTENADRRKRRRLRRRIQTCGAAAFFTLVLLYEWFSLDRGFVVCFLDVGQGDGILIRTEAGTHILIDGGSTSEDQVGEYVLLSAVRYYGMADLDYVFVTHGDEDHVSGIRYLLETEHTGVRIRHLVVAEHGDLDGLAELIALAEEKGVSVLCLDAGDEIAETENGATLRCLSPAKDVGYSNANDASLVLEMEMRGHRFLFTGDMGEETEAKLAEAGALQDCEVLKVGHHGSKYASTEMFLEAVSPEYAVISCSETNRYGHPAEETLARLSNAGAEIHCTMNEGAVLVTLADGGLLVRGYR